MEMDGNNLKKVNKYAKGLNQRRLDALPSQHANFRRMLSTVEGCSDQAIGKTTLHIPGHDYSCFDRTGNLSFYSITRMIELDRLLNSSKGRFETLFSKVAPVTENVYGMVAAHELHVSKDMYSKAAIVRPMVCNFELGYLGNSSFSSITTYIDKETGKQLFLSERHIALRERLTNKPWYIQDDVKQKYKKYASKEKTILSKPPKRPMETFVYDILVRHSDHDIMFHVNQGTFISFCLECAAEASLSGFYSDFQGDMAWYHVKDASIIYLGEAFAGDLLKVISWEGVDHSLHFEIHRDSDVIVNCTLVFFQDIGHQPHKL